MTCFLGGTQGRRIGESTSADGLKRAANDLGHIFPGWDAAATGAGHLVNWRKNPWSLGSYSCYRVGQYTTMRGFESLSLRGLYFAGEHCSLTSKAFMNGAAESGRHAAESIVRDIRS